MAQFINSPMIFGTFLFLTFLILIAILRIGKWKAPYRALFIIHFIYGVSSLGVFSLIGFPGLESMALTYVVYFAWNYAFFANFFASLSRGFSLNLCISIFKHGGKANVNDLLSSYGGGKGLAYVKDNRIQVLKESGAVKETEGKLVLTPFGIFAVRLNRFVQKSLGTQIPRERAIMNAQELSTLFVLFISYVITHSLVLHAFGSDCFLKKSLLVFVLFFGASIWMLSFRSFSYWHHGLFIYFF